MPEEEEQIIPILDHKKGIYELEILMVKTYKDCYFNLIRGRQDTSFLLWQAYIIALFNLIKMEVEKLDNVTFKDLCVKEQTPISLPYLDCLKYHNAMIKVLYLSGLTKLALKADDPLMQYSKAFK